ALGVAEVVVVQDEELVLRRRLGQRRFRRVRDVHLEAPGPLERVVVQAAGVPPVMVVVPGDQQRPDGRLAHRDGGQRQNGGGGQVQHGRSVPRRPGRAAR